MVMVMVVTVPVPVVVFGMHVAGHTIAGVEQALADADEAPVAHPGQAQGAAVGAHEAVGQGAARVLVVAFVVVMVMIVVVMAVGIAQHRAFGVAGDVDVAGFAVQGVDVEHEPSGRRGAVQPHHAGALVVDTAGAQLGAAFQRARGGGLGNASVDHVDRTADGAIAVQQAGRPLQHLDLGGEEGLDADRVVDADRRHVAGGQAVAQHLHARALEAADDRPADAGAEERGLHPGQARDGFADGAGPGLVEAFAGQHRHRAGQVFGGAGERIGADGEGIQVGDAVFVVMVVGVPGRVPDVLRERGRGGQGEQQGGGEQGGAGRE